MSFINVHEKYYHKQVKILTSHKNSHVSNLGIVDDIDPEAGLLYIKLNGSSIVTEAISIEDVQLLPATDDSYKGLK